MTTFYQWLRYNKEKPNNAVKVKSRTIIGYFDCPLRIEEDSIYVTKKESEMLIKMEKYLKEFPEVTEEQFAIMIDDWRLFRYKALIKNYDTVDGGIATELRDHGWFAVAKYIAYKRNVDARFQETCKKALSGFNDAKFTKLNKKSNKEMNK